MGQTFLFKLYDFWQEKMHKIYKSITKAILYKNNWKYIHLKKIIFLYT